MTPRPIITRYDPPALGDSCFDWVAEQSPWEPGDPVGVGETPEEAEQDLREQLEDLEP